MGGKIRVREARPSQPEWVSTFRVPEGGEIVPVYASDLTHFPLTGKMGRWSSPGDQVLPMPTRSTTKGTPADDPRSKSAFILVCLLTRQVPDAFGYSDR